MRITLLFLSCKQKNDIMTKILCGSSKRTKHLFETEEKANRFIEYNAASIENVNGYAPIRCYYCNTCGGWHVTSQQQLPDGKLVSQYRTNKNFSRSSFSTLQQKIKDSFEFHFISLEIAAVELIDNLLSFKSFEDKELELKNLFGLCRHFNGKDSQMEKVKKLLAILQTLKREGLNPYLQKRLENIRKFFKNRLGKNNLKSKESADPTLHRLVSLCQQELDASMSLYENDRYNEAKVVLATAKRYFKQIAKTDGMNYKKKKLFCMINELESNFAMIA